VEFLRSGSDKYFLSLANSRNITFIQPHIHGAIPLSTKGQQRHNYLRRMCVLSKLAAPLIYISEVFSSNLGWDTLISLLQRYDGTALTTLSRNNHPQRSTLQAASIYKPYVNISK
jgi:hypothetical protein